MTELNYKNELEIDELDLVGSWLEQSIFYGKWSELWAEASYRVDKLKEMRKVQRAQIYYNVKTSPEKFGWQEDKSPTEGFIDSQIRLNKKFQNISKDLNKATREMNILQSAKEAFYHRRKALESLSQLFTTSYYVDGPARTRTTKKIEEREAMDAQKQKLRNRKGGKE